MAQERVSIDELEQYLAERLKGAWVSTLAAGARAGCAGAPAGLSRPCWCTWISRGVVVQAGRGFRERGADAAGARDRADAAPAV